MHSNDPLTVVGGRTVPALVREGAARHPDRPLLVFEDAEGRVSTLSWHEVRDRARALAGLLARAGVGRGDRVHLHLPNRPEFVLTWFAAAELGASVVPTNTAATAHELSYVIGHSGAATSVTDAAGAPTVRAARAEAAATGPLLVCEHDPVADAPSVDGRVLADPPVTPADELAVMYTSGTTARPKGVRLTHANYVYAGEVVAGGLRLGPEDRFLTVLPLFHANAQYYSTMGTLIGGGTVVLAARFSAGRLLDQAIRHEATVASLFAAPIRMILAQEPHARWREHRLRVVVFAQNLTDEQVARWDELVGAPLLQLYGMTETVGPPLMNPLAGPRRHDTVGRVVLGYACRVVREDGTPAGVGEPGELLVSGVPGISLMAGYLHDPAATAEVLQDGWLRTGDVVAVDADGYVRFVDRRKDMIKRSGENVAASEVEAALLAHPAVAEAAVVGVPDPMRDEQIVAFVVLAPGARTEPAELVDWCGGRLSKFRVPGTVVVRDALPRTSVGKVQKHLLRTQFTTGGAAELPA